jgi:hypothetical protein
MNEPFMSMLGVCVYNDEGFPPKALGKKGSILGWIDLPRLQGALLRSRMRIVLPWDA